MSSPALSDRDSMLRVAAFTALRQIPSAEPGQLSRDQMTAGFEFQGERIAFALRARGIWKPRQAPMPLCPSPLRLPDKMSHPGMMMRLAVTGGSTTGTKEPTLILLTILRCAAPLNSSGRSSTSGDRHLAYRMRFGQSIVVVDDPGNLTFQLAADAVGLGEPSLIAGGGEELTKRYATVAVKRAFISAASANWWSPLTRHGARFVPCITPFSSTPHTFSRVATKGAFPKFPTGCHFASFIMAHTMLTYSA